MSLLLYLILLAFSGLVVGGLARLALPGPDPMSIPATIGIGIAGSFVAGLVMYLIFGHAVGGGLILSVACAAFFVWLVRRSRGQSVWSTRRRPGSNPYRF
jgi:uncharacterized membrane protein YeaQ/YmgE (transglycosylase-associated protein family)